jgi:5,10-methenyltetrahydromethanopterin hydrogenase
MPTMSDRPTHLDGAPDEVLDRIRERVLAKEQEQRDYKMVHGLRPELKEIVEQEITEDHLD